MVPRFVLTLLIGAAAWAQEFREHTIATGLIRGYQVIPADMNGDGRPDLIALASGMPELVWYENPSWQRHVITGPFTNMINVAAHDLDGDGVPELALAYEFANVAKNSVGTVAILRFRGGKWTAQEIDRVPTSHRLRWADFLGTGKKVLVNSVLTGATAEPPDFAAATPLYFYDPKDWKRQSIPVTNRGVVHGIVVRDWNGDGKEDVLTAGFTGIDVYRWDGNWKRERVAKGSPADWPKGGSSDVAIGTFGKERFVAAVEPWHGNMVAVYTGGKRIVIDNALADGHTIVTADLDGDGRDEIIAGCRGGPKAVYVYRFDGKVWGRRALDEGGMPAAACIALDLNGDKRVDIACIGAASQTLKWYENRGSTVN
ncbi:MAG TPA: VCBS repeat-containing protein [Bryobacteraceae bacterium]|nr:VCBS repeat-containing protein [Bryobacteraceae bacterium]